MPDALGERVFVVNVCGLALGATAAVVIRLLNRYLHRTKLAYDDLFVTGALVPLWGLAGTGILIFREGGLGQPKALLSSSQYDVFYRAIFASNILYIASITAAKLSVLLLYRRVFTVRLVRLFVDLCAIYSFLWGVAVFMIFLFECDPLVKGWNPDLPGRCLNLESQYYGISVSNAALDIIINLLPLRPIWQLQLPVRQRVVLILIMGLGFMSVVASVGRIFAIPQLMDQDLPATIADPFFYGVVEPSSAIIAACLPTYRSIFSWLCHAVFGACGSNKSGHASSMTQSDSSHWTDKRRVQAGDRFALLPPASRPIVTRDSTSDSVPDSLEGTASLKECQTSRFQPIMPPKARTSNYSEMPQKRPVSPIRLSVHAHSEQEVTPSSRLQAKPAPKLRASTTSGLLFGPSAEHFAHLRN